jgi:two-component system NtrC family sensor kinase
MRSSAMRVVPKLTLAFILCTTTVLSANGLLRVNREVAVFEHDRIRDHRLMGRALGEAIAAVWRSDGEARALSVLAHVDVPDAHIRVHWVWLDELAAKRPVDVVALNAIPLGAPLNTVWIDDSGADFRNTYVRLDVGGPRAGALELSESLMSQHRFVKGTILDTVIATASLSLAAACLSMLLGVWIVGRPMRSLMEKARRTGQRDFSGPLHLEQDDELAELAREMNTMCERLVDASQRVESETHARIDAIEQLRHADRLMTVGKLASGIAHELGTPLNVVEARAGMIAAGETSHEETLDYARIIVDAAGRMTRIIRQLLEFARRKGPQKNAQQLAPVIARTLELLRPLGAKKQVTLSLESVETHPVDVDASQFEQVVTNLVVNGIQSMKQAGTLLVRVSEETTAPPVDLAEGDETRQKRPYACVRIVDEGEGIPEDHLSHIFEPFFTTKDVGEGTGLGLSVAYGIVRDHGGWIDVQSEVGKGTEFRVYLPLAPARRAEVREERVAT